MLVVVAGVLVRIALLAVFPGVASFFDNRVEVTTPVTSYTRLQEGLFLVKHHISPYTGDLFYQSPLLLGLFSTLPSQPLLISAFYALIDGVSASALARIAKSRPSRSYSPEILAVVYLANPFSLVGGMARSTSVFTNCAIALSLRQAVTGKPTQAVVLLALATCLSWYPFYLLLPVLVLAAQHTYRRHTLLYLTVAYFVSVAAFLGFSYLPVLSWEFIPKVYGTQVMLSDLTRPNLGLWWYFFIEMFSAFRPFFLGIFQLFIGIFPVPLTIRFPHEPLFAVTCALGLHATFKPYPEVSDVGFFLAMLLLNRKVVELMRFKLASILGLLYVSALAPTFYNLWIFVGSGNANFFYAITLVYSLTMTLTLSEAVWAAVRLDYDGGRSSNLMQI